jgi:hypothetical protein
MVRVGLARLAARVSASSSRVGRWVGRIASTARFSAARLEV